MGGVAEHSISAVDPAARPGHPVETCVAAAGEAGEASGVGGPRAQFDHSRCTGAEVDAVDPAV